MIGALRHRGPDEFGVYRDRDAGLGHARLSIIDLASGQQPLSNETGTLWISFNGEIFNYVELRHELEARGHRFRTRSDTEVIVHAYEEWREDAFRRFNGQWAVALWDCRAPRARARAGSIRRTPPLCDGTCGATVLRQRGQGDLRGGSVAPEAFRSRRARPALHVLDDRVAADGVCGNRGGRARKLSGPIRPAGVTYARAWDPSFPVDGQDGFTGSVEEATERVRVALEEATSLRMLRADVPVGSYLSGGLDSSLIAALGLRAKGSRFSTFSLRFEDAEYDETTYQRQMVDNLGSDHHDVLVSRADIARVFPSVIVHTERPVLRTAPAPLYMLSELVRQSGIKVVLTGEGADEMFAGYDLFREAKVRRFWARQPQSTRRPRLLERLYPYLARSPVSQRAMARQFFGQQLARASEAGFGHLPRWNGASALKRLFSPALRS